MTLNPDGMEVNSIINELLSLLLIFYIAKLPFIIIIVKAPNKKNEDIH